MITRVRRADGNPPLAQEVVAALGPDGPGLRACSHGRLTLSDGREAWRSGPAWLVGPPGELARLWEVAARDELAAALADVLSEGPVS